MTEFDGPTGRPRIGVITRREFLGRAGALGASALSISGARAVDVHAAETPRKGGTLRLGLAGGSASDNLEVGLYDDSVASVMGRGLYNGLVEWGDDGRPKPDLALFWEARSGAKDWIVNLRKGVRFSNGKEFNADDAIYSLNYHRGETVSGGRFALAGVSEIKKLDVHQIQITLISPDADFPTGLTDNHILMFPDGFTDWANPIGTGAFRLDHFDPGVRISLVKNPDFWKENRGHLDAAEILVVNDSAARFSALKSGQIDIINRVNPKFAATLDKASGLKLVRAASGYHVVAAMQVDKPPFDSLEFRLAMKLAVDREAILKSWFAGYGALGNDHPIPPTDPYFNSELPPRKHDPERAAFHLKKSGLANANFVLQTNDLVFNGSADAAQLLRANWSAAGLRADVKQEPAEGYWDNVWLKGPFVASYWRGRAAATQMLAAAYGSRSPENETHWSNSKFETLLASARGETEEAKRKPYIWEMQKLLSEDGGAIIPAFRDWLDAHHEKVGGHTATGGAELANRYILEKAWIRA